MLHSYTCIIHTHECTYVPAVNYIDSEREIGDGDGLDHARHVGRHPLVVWYEDLARALLLVCAECNFYEIYVRINILDC